MTYTEWHDELKSNLLCVSEAERRRVLDYYAEAYADRREAGFSEREIIEDFGAPYDAAQRILAENTPSYEAPPKTEIRQAPFTPPPPPPQKTAAPAATAAPETPQTPVRENKKSGGGAGFAVLCVLLALPVLIIIFAMVIATVVLCAGPVAVAVVGGVSVGAAIGTLFAGEVTYGFYMLGQGLLGIGIGLALAPLTGKLTVLMWKGFNKFFGWLKNTLVAKKAGA